ncbi:MAG: HDIG domain-containing protein [Spirochaetaceae bacterium]|nr:HDIG domain-containing protein [Spirochaetaceae bacterium]
MIKRTINSAENQNPFLIRFLRQLRETIQSPKMFLAGLGLLVVVVLPALFPVNMPVFTFTGHLILDILLFYLFFFLLCGHRSTGRKLNTSEFYLLSALTAVYFLSSHFLNGYKFYSGDMPAAVVLPTALVVMLVSILVSTRYAQVMAVLLPLGAFISGSIDNYSFWFALASGIPAAFVLNGVKKRMDMVKAGCVVALSEVVAMCAILLIKDAQAALFPPVLCFAAVNGIASGMLVLGITPILENFLHSATAFRLIELLDLSAPLMRMLASKTPGTFTHSLIVANLAEAACHEIGAKSLLARVGAYYHDIGKIDQPAYFVENQHESNKHDEINPRLSATVIRSHVKLGIEKGRAAGLPNEVIDIIASHHGNSLIAYFYHEALKKEDNVNMEDFCYPGNPPRTKEAAIIMLADVTEAAVRTLEKPGTSRLEKFINELINKKIDSAQLSESELTFRELETIKKVFVRVLASYYHTRIEYPDQNKDAPKDDE